VQRLRRGLRPNVTATIAPPSVHAAERRGVLNAATATRRGINHACGT
jgi:hypothetical protein